MPRNREGLVRVDVWLPWELWRRYAELARRDDRSLHYVILRALREAAPREAVTEEDGEAEPDTRAPHARDTHAAVAGPADSMPG